MSLYNAAVVDTLSETEKKRLICALFNQGELKVSIMTNEYKVRSSLSTLSYLPYRPTLFDRSLTPSHQIDYNAAAAEFGAASSGSMRVCVAPILKKFKDAQNGGAIPTPAKGSGGGGGAAKGAKAMKRKKVDDDGDDEVAPTPKGKGGKKASPAKKPKKEEAVDDGE